MTLSKKSIFVALKWLLMVLFVAGITLAILDEALRAFRARYNKEGTLVKKRVPWLMGLPSMKRPDRLPLM
jgi:hypothetical protein